MSEQISITSTGTVILLVVGWCKKTKQQQQTIFKHCKIAPTRYTFKYRPVWLGLRQGEFTCDGWQVILCDHIWQVTSHSSEMEFH